MLLRQRIIRACGLTCVQILPNSEYDNRLSELMKQWLECFEELTIISRNLLSVTSFPFSYGCFYFYVSYTSIVSFVPFTYSILLKYQLIEY